MTEISSWGSFAISSSIASSEPATSDFRTRFSSCSSPFEDVLERDLLAAAPCQRLGLQPRRALAGELPGAALVLDDADALARLGHAVEAEHLDRLTRQRLVDPVAEEVVHRAHAAPVGPGDERVPDLKRAAHDQDRDHGTAARVELRLDHRAGGRRVRVRAQLLELGHRDDRLEQIVEALPRLRRDVDELGIATPLDRLQADRGHLAADPVGVGALLVDLVDRHEHRHAGLLGVVDRLLGLRLDAVVGGDDDHRDVGDLGAARTHRGERLVARRVEERDGAVRRGGPGRRRCAG